MRRLIFRRVMLAGSLIGLVCLSAPAPSLAHGGGHMGGGGGHGGGFGGGRVGGGFGGGHGGGFGQQGHWGGGFVRQPHQSGWTQQSQHPGYNSAPAGYGGHGQAQPGMGHANNPANMTRPVPNAVGGLQHSGAATNFHHPQANTINNAVRPNVNGSQLHPNTIASQLQPNAAHHALANSITTAAGNKVPANNQLAANIMGRGNAPNSTGGGSLVHNVFKPSSGVTSKNQSLLNRLQGKNNANAANALALAGRGSGSNGNNTNSNSNNGRNNNSNNNNSNNGNNSNNNSGNNSNNNSGNNSNNNNGNTFVLGRLGGGGGGGGAIVIGGGVSMPVVVSGGGADPGIVDDWSDGAVAVTSDFGPTDPGIVSTPVSQAVSLVLLNPNDSPGSVNYTLDAAAYSLDAGGSLGYSGSGPWLVEFDRGVGGVQARYSLDAGTYTFSWTDQGWNLLNTNVSQASATPASIDPPATDAPAGENSQRIVLQNPKSTSGPVNFVIDGTPYTLAVGSSQELSPKAPCLIEFDRGTGGATGRYTLASGYYTFSVSDNGWELTSATLDNSGNGSE